MFGLQELSQWIDSAISSSGSGGSDQLAQNLYQQGFAQWFSRFGFPILIGIAVFVVVLFIFYGAFLYFTAYGDENRATQAKKTLAYAFVGLIIVLMAFAIASFIQRLLIDRNVEQGVTAPTGTGGGTTDPRNLPPL